MRGFRVWNEREKTYDDGWDYLLSSDGNLYALKYGALVSMSGADYLTVEFDAGLKDNNGKEIYEGDIFEDDYNGGYEVVKWIDERSAFCLCYMGYERDVEGFDTRYTNEMEVIGNIHKNPELLEEE